MSHSAPDALLFIAPGCAHCPGVLEGLSALVKEGAVGRLEVVNVAVHPERAAEYGIRSTPWLRLGPFELVGARTPAALREWARLAGSGEGWTAYAREILSGGDLSRAERLTAEVPGFLEALLPLLADTETPMQVRIGVVAVMEGAAGGDALRGLVPRLIDLAGHEDHRVRADACHLLGLTGAGEAAATLRARLSDEHPEVREIAADALGEK